jgi:hypothetical protein
MARWFFYAVCSALLLGFVLGMKHLASIETGTFGRGFGYGAFIMACIMVLGFWLQQRDFDRQSDEEDR